MADGFVILAPVEEYFGEIVVRLGVIGIEGDCAPIMDNRLVQLAVGCQYRAEIVFRDPRGRITHERSAEERFVIDVEGALPARQQK